MKTWRRLSVARIDRALGLTLLAFAIALFLVGELAARHAMANYGYNVDSGALEETFAMFIVLPAAIALLLAARLDAAKSVLGSALHHIGVVLATIVAAIAAFYTIVG